MGSWAKLDANYPPGTLTPATALVVALGHLAGARSVYAGAVGGPLAAFLPRRGLAYDQDLLARAERYLQEVPVDQFIAEAGGLLNARQKLCLAINLLDALLAAGHAQPHDHAFFGQMLEGLGLTAEQIQPYWPALALKNDLTIFPQ